MMKKRQIFIALLGLAFLCSIASPGASAQLPKFGKKKQPAAKDKTANPDVNSSAQPDKILYDRALDDIKHGRYTEGRLSLQTLINTYPDSEYLAKAKLAVADSYFKEGGTGNLTQAVAEYKDFITFFPFLEEAAYAQMQVGMAHYKMMEKSDRDSSQAQMAEDEFQGMLLKFPQSPLAPQAEQRLREVQEVLADGEYKIAHFYYTKQDYRASAARLIEVVNRYPLYSGTDEALWILGDIYTKVKLGAKNEDQRNYWSVMSGKVYTQIVEQYPLSARAPEAKNRLKQMGLPVPAANPDALVRMQKERDYEKQHHQNAILKAPMGMVHTAPDVSLAAHIGPPNLNPPDDAVAASEVLKPNAAGVSGFTLSGSTSTSADGTNAPATDISTAPAKQEDAAVSNPGTVETGPAGGTTLGVQIIQPSAASPSGATNSDATATNSSAAGTVDQANPPTAAAAQPAPNATDTSGTGAAPTATSAAPAADSSSNARPAGTQAGNQTDQSANDSTSAGANSQSPAPASTSTDDSKDSSSKKKKGVHKLIPW